MIVIFYFQKEKYKVFKIHVNNYFLRNKHLKASKLMRTRALIRGISINADTLCE